MPIGRIFYGHPSMDTRHSEDGYLLVKTTTEAGWLQVTRRHLAFTHLKMYSARHGEILRDVSYIESQD